VNQSGRFSLFLSEISIKNSKKSSFDRILNHKFIFKSMTHFSNHQVSTESAAEYVNQNDSTTEKFVQ